MFNFPNTPTLGQTFAPSGGPTYVWDGTAWRALGPAAGPATVLVSDTPPPNPGSNQLWWESDTSKLYIWYSDADSSQWVQIFAGPTGATGETGATGPAGPVGPVGPTPSIEPGLHETTLGVASTTISVLTNAIQTSGYSLAGDGGGALYKRVVSEPAHAGKVQSMDGAWWEIAETIVSPQMFGAKADSVTNDAAALNAAVTVTTPLHFPPGIYNIGTTTFAVPAVVSFTMDPGAQIKYSGTGIAIHIDAGSTVDPHRYGRWDIRVVRATVDWDDGVDTSSVGVRLTNIRQAQVNVWQVDNFFIGLQPYGDTTGTVDNTFSIGLIRNCRYGIKPDRINAGWANQNMFIGGGVRLDSAYANLVGFPGTLIDLTLGNGNTFIGINIEGNLVLPCKALYCSGGFNTFIGMRWEGQGTGTAHFDTTSVGNFVQSGYNNFGPSGVVFDDDGTENRIAGSRGASFFGDTGGFGGPAVIAKALSGDGAIAFQTWDTAKEPHFEVTGGGELRLYGGDGKGIVAFNNLALVPSTGSLNMGAGTAAVASVLRCSSETTLDMQNKYWRTDNNARRGGRLVALAAAATSINITVGLVFQTNNTGATSISSISGGIDGQEFFIRANDANTTLVHSANFRTRTGANIVMANGDVAAFMATGSGTAVQI